MQFANELSHYFLDFMVFFFGASLAYVSPPRSIFAIHADGLNGGNHKTIVYLFLFFQVLGCGPDEEWRSYSLISITNRPFAHCYCYALIAKYHIHIWNCKPCCYRDKNRNKSKRKNKKAYSIPLFSNSILYNLFFFFFRNDIIFNIL